MARLVFSLAMLAATNLCVAAPNPESCRELRKHGKTAEAAECFEELSQSADPYTRAEGLWGLGDWDGANQSFRVAAARPGSKAEVRVRWGMLLHERFNNGEADGLFVEALKLDPASATAYLGRAIVSADGFNSHAAEYAAKALAIDSKLVAAHELLADLDLENQKTGPALEEADKALALSDEAAEAMAVHAAAEVLADRDGGAWLARISKVNPHNGEGLALVGYHLVLNRRYDDGVSYYRRAIATDPQLWAAHSQLGINLMRLGKEEEPLKELGLAYEHGQKDAATVNSLRLLDSYKTFSTFRDDTTILRLRKNEAELLQPYFEAELHQAMATYERKYKMKLPNPVQLEVYPDHEDFAVRTMGMPGLGALGVTFGEVVAMDSPAGRKPGDFNWASTLWHEMSHVYVLSATRHRVPRWFTEGLAVHEEGQAHAEWANRLTPEVLIAIRDHKLLPVAEIDRGFIFPEYPEQVTVSYFEAGSMCDFVQERWGMEALLGIIHSFAVPKTTPEAVEDNLHLSAELFDKEYLSWLTKQVGAEPENFDRWRIGLKELAALAQAKEEDKVLAKAPALLQMYPQYVGDASVYEFLSAAEIAGGDKSGALATLSAFRTRGGESPRLLKQLAALQEEAGDPVAAAATLNSINYIYPEDEALHRHLGELWLKQGNAAGAVQEFTAVLALKPLDRAGAQYELATAYFAQGDKVKAEESVLAALETAPGFRPAQKLLLEIEAKK